jgi:hypothetical protein
MPPPSNNNTLEFGKQFSATPTAVTLSSLDARADAAPDVGALTFAGGVGALGIAFVGARWRRRK